MYARMSCVLPTTQYHLQAAAMHVTPDIGDRIVYDWIACKFLHSHCVVLSAAVMSHVVQQTEQPYMDDRAQFIMALTLCVLGNYSYLAQMSSITISKRSILLHVSLVRSCRYQLLQHRQRLVKLLSLEWSSTCSLYGGDVQEHCEFRSGRMSVLTLVVSYKSTA